MAKKGDARISRNFLAKFGVGEYADYVRTVVITTRDIFEEDLPPELAQERVLVVSVSHQLPARLPLPQVYEDLPVYVELRVVNH